MISQSLAAFLNRYNCKVVEDLDETVDILVRATEENQDAMVIKCLITHWNPGQPFQWALFAGDVCFAVKVGRRILAREADTYDTSEVLEVELTSRPNPREWVAVKQLLTC